MSSRFEFDARGFHVGLQRKLAATKRATPDVVNKAMRDGCLRAVKYTPKANPAAIERELTTGGLAFRLLQSPAYQSRLPGRLRGFTRGTHTRRQIDAAVKQLVAARRRSAAHLKAGWLKASQSFGGTSQQRVSDKGLAGRSYGRRATAGNPVGEAANLARGASTIGAPGLARALEETGADMIAYAERKLAAAWR